MGQAKQRGTYEERKALAIQERDIALAEQRSIRVERHKKKDHEADMREMAIVKGNSGGIAVAIALSMLSNSRTYR